MRLNMGRFRGCYQQALLAQPALSGVAKLRFVIGRDGSVSHCRVMGIEHAPELAQCLQRQMYSVGFPQPVGGIVTVVYPLRLEPPYVPTARQLGDR